MCARWPATWAAISAASAISPSCAGSRSSRSPPTISSRSTSWKPRCLPADADEPAERRSLRGDRRLSRRDGGSARLPAAGRRHRRCRLAHPARQCGDRARPRRAGRGRGGLRHGARQAGRDRRDRGRHVQAEAGFCRLTKTVSNSARSRDWSLMRPVKPARRCSTKAARRKTLRRSPVGASPGTLIADPEGGAVGAAA